MCISTASTRQASLPTTSSSKQDQEEGSCKGRPKGRPLLFPARGTLSWRYDVKAKESRSPRQTLRPLRQADGLAPEMGEELGRGEILLGALCGRGEGGAAVRRLIGLRQAVRVQCFTDPAGWLSIRERQKRQAQSIAPRRMREPGALAQWRSRRESCQTPARS